VLAIFAQSPRSEEAIFQEAESNGHRLDYVRQKMEQKKALRSMQKVSKSALPCLENTENQDL
jgi:hypothetical protein